MVVNLRSTVGVGLIWFAAVAGVSVTAWVAIDRAGRDVTDGTVNSLSPLPVGAVPAVTRTPGIGSPPTAVAPQKSEAHEPSATSTSPDGQEASAAPTSAALPGSATPRDGTFMAAGGQVSVRCSGDRIQLRIAQPDDGWRVKVGSAGPGEVRLIFMRGDEEGGSGTEVTALCAAGTPGFTVASDS